MSGMFHRETEQACRELDRARRGLPEPWRPAGGQRRVHRPGRMPADLRRDVRPQHDADRPRRRRARRCRRDALDGGQRIPRNALVPLAAADAAPGRDGGQAVNVRRKLLAMLAATAAVCSADALGQTAASPPSPPPPIGELKSLGQERYQVGRIVVDKRARSFTVPGRVHVLGKPLEYLATSPGGMKAYETLLELDASGSEFNLACILIGLERDPSRCPPGNRSAGSRSVGQRVDISRWRGSTAASGARYRPRRRCSIRMPASSPNRSNGSTSARSRRFDGRSVRGGRHWNADRLRQARRQQRHRVGRPASASAPTDRCAATRCCRPTALPSNWSSKRRPRRSDRRALGTAARGGPDAARCTGGGRPRSAAVGLAVDGDGRGRFAGPAVLAGNRGDAQGHCAANRRLVDGGGWAWQRSR